MAEGGDFGYDDPDLDRKFDNYDDEDENEVTRDGYDSERGKEYRSPDLETSRSSKVVDCKFSVAKLEVSKVVKGWFLCRI